MASIQELMAQLGAMNYNAPSSYKGYQSSGIDIGYKPINLTPYNFTQNDFKSLSKAKKVDGSVNLWDVLSGTLGQPSGLITHSLYKTIEDLKDPKQGFWEKAFNVGVKDNILGSLVEGAVAGGKRQWKEWTDDDISWGDAGASFLHGMDKHWKRGQDIAKDHMDIDNRWGQVGTGIGLDIALDPLTYLTGGLSAASKLGKVEEMKKIADLSKGLGIVGKYKNVDEFSQAASQAIKSSVAKKFTTPDGRMTVSQATIDKTANKQLQKMLDEVNTARNTKFNAHINDWGFGVPFTNKFAKVGTYGKKNLLHRSEAIVPKATVDNLIHKAANGNEHLKGLLEQATKARYGVGTTAQLSKTMFDDLHEFLNPVVQGLNKKGIPDVAITQSIVEKTMPKAKFNQLMDDFKKQNIPWKDVEGQLDQILQQVGKNPKLRESFGAQLAEMVAKYWEGKQSVQAKHVTKAKAESMRWASQFLKTSGKIPKVKTKVDKVYKNGVPFKQSVKHRSQLNKQLDSMTNTQYGKAGEFKTRFEHALDKRNPFDARTLGTGDKFVNSMGEHIADSSSQRIGETAMYTNDISKIEQFIKNYTGDKEELMRNAIYILENHAPKSKRVDGFTPDMEAQQLAQMIKPLLDKVAKGEQESGVLNNLRANYFPHVLKQTDNDMEEIQKFINEDPTGLMGKSSSSKFNNARKTFQTMAQRDEYIESLEKAIQKATDDDTIESLKKQQERVAEMFDTDVVSVLRRRVREGVRAKAMKDMQGKLAKYGMFHTVKKGSKDSVPDGLKLLDEADAKKMGLGEGKHYMHPDVLNGLKRVDEIFTEQGMNKAVRHVSAIADIWRPLVTNYKPSHYLNNIIGNVINNLAAGVGVRDYAAAGKLIKAYKNGTATEAQKKIMEQAYKNNVVSGGFLYDAHQSFDFKDPTKLEKIAKKVGDNKAINKVKLNLGEKPDDIARLANFINGMNKHGRVSEAAKQVRTYLFNYNELTNADRMTRVLVPFWNWTKRNVPLQMKTLMENPKFAMNIERFKNLFNEGQEGEDWQKNSGIKIPFTDYYTTVPSPTQDLEMLMNPRQFASSVTPALKIPTEIMFNEKIFNGSPISYGSENMQGQDLLPYLISNTGIGKNAYDAFSGERSIGESIMNLLKPVSKIREE